ncbi:MAG: M48 family metallopeptidase [Porticoccaceae bacterium]|nr:M48 family metallopeptidase [Porticoccaceae bacterium]
MLEYENRLPTEGINVSEDKPLKEFFILIAGFAAVIAIVVLLLSLVAGRLVRFIPFETELRLSEKALSTSSIEIPQLSPQQQEVEVYLQALADKLAIAQVLPDGMTITVHYIDDDTVNAFATLGGHVVMFRGLVEQLPHENALAMVMAHEIAHIKHRDPLVAVGRGLTVGLALVSIAGMGDSGVASMFFGQVGLMTALNFSRQQETAADEEAVQTLLRQYGHVLGAEVLFEVLQDNSESLEPPVFLSTHPVTEKRIEALAAYKAASITRGKITPLPEILRSDD